MDKIDVHVDIVNDFTIRLRPCDACLKHKLAGYWNKIVIRDRDRPIRIYYACSNVCQLTVLRADEEAYP